MSFAAIDSDLFWLLAPRPMQLQAGAQDQLITPTDRDTLYQTVRPVYGKFGSAEHLNYVLHKERHIMFWEQANKFINQYLK